LRVITVADTHLFHNEIDIPEGDVLVHCGDFSRTGHVNEIRRVNGWLQEIGPRFRYVLVVAGNHDQCFCPKKASELIREEAKRVLLQGTANVRYLEDESTWIDDVEFYGSPWQPEFCDWGFNLPRNSEELKEKWAAIPETTDVLITHGPPKGVLDLNRRDSFACGCELLHDRIRELQPTYHLFGHIHEGYGVNQYILRPTVCVNASVCNERYEPLNQPIVLEI
jgi:Icc-related predicted phosphoesterase